MLSEQENNIDNNNNDVEKTETDKTDMKIFI
jgi:hypothetical protein